MSRASSTWPPRASIRSAIITEDPWIWLRGIRAPGTSIPLTLAMGTWKFYGGKDFVLIKGSRPSVVIDVVGEEFARHDFGTQICYLVRGSARESLGGVDRIR